MGAHEPNELIRIARLARPSMSVRDRPMSRQELADAVNAYLWHTTGQVSEMSRRYVEGLEAGRVRWPRAPYRAALRAVLHVASDADLGFYGSYLTCRPQRSDRGRTQVMWTQALEGTDTVLTVVSFPDGVAVVHQRHGRPALPPHGSEQPGHLSGG